MLSTVEVRWFLRGAIPPDIWGWFYEQGSEPEEQPPRVDYYLRLWDGDSLGIKLRQGRIEVKQRYDQPVVVHFGGETIGSVERWRKWSFQLNEPGGMIAELSGYSSQWIGVRKERRLRTYQVVADKRVVEVSDSYNIDQGCGWEVAQVSVANSEWWSVGFEAFGQEHVLQGMMVLVADYVLAQEEAPILGLEDSYSYPRWLQHVAGRHT